MKRGQLGNLIPFSFFVLLVLLFGVVLSASLIAENQTENQTLDESWNESNINAFTNAFNFTIENYDGSKANAEILVYEREGWKKLEDLSRIEKGKHDVRISLNQKIKEIEFKDLAIDDAFKPKLKIDTKVPPEKVPGALEVYAIDPTALNFTEATVTVTAKGEELWKCKTWDFEARECKPTCEIDEETGEEICHSGWQKLMDITPGEDYSFTLTPEDPAYAEYNASLGAPRCNSFESPCIANSSLLRCNDNQAAPGPEPNQPNTIDTCTDSTISGTCHSRESVENITVTDLNSSYFRPGDTVNVTVWWYCYSNADRIALYYTNSTSSIVWKNELVGTTICPTAGYYSRNITFTLDNVTGDHAVRAIILYNTNIGSACPTGNYRDQDDVAFRVAAKPVTTLNTPPDNYWNDSAPQVNVTFNCSATADVPLANISLYITNSSNQSFSLNQSTNVSGTSNSTAWTLTLSVGNYTWNCLTYDNASQSDWGDANRSLKINWTDKYPTTILVSPPNGYTTTSKDINFTCNATDDIQLSNITFYWNYSGSWQANGTVAVSGTSNQTTFERTNLSNGAILWNCRACDNASQCSFAPANWTVTVNYTNTAPQYSNVGSNTTTPYTNEPILHYAYWTDNEALSGYIFSSNYSGSWANDSFVSMTGAGNWSNVTKNAPSTSGVYGWRIYANNSYGLWNVTDIQIIIVQNRAPQIALNLPANNTQFNNTQDINFNFTATDDQNTTLSCSIYLDSVLNQTNSSVQNNTLTNFLITGISYGNHNWSVNCSDGSLSNVSETRYFTINDTDIPSIYFNPNTDASGTYSKNWIFVNVTCSDLHKDTVILNWNGTNESFDNSAGDIYWENKTGLSDGTYSFYAWCNDTSGNSNSTETRNVTIDTTAPQVTLNSPDDGLLTGNATIVFNCSAQDATNLANITLWLNSSGGWHANETHVVSGNSNSTTFIKTFDQGTYLWSCSACDEFGHCNESFSENRTFTIDLNAPSINYVLPTDANNAYVARLWTFVNVTVSDANNVSSCWLEWDGINESMTMQGIGQEVYCYVNKTGGEGQHSYNVYANDTLNNIAIAGERTITFDITPPTIENVSITSITSNSATIIWQTNEPANSTINYGTDLNLSNNVSDSGLVINHSIALTGLSAKTTYYFNITSCDAVGNCNTSGYYNFTTLSRGGGGGGRAEERAEGEKPEEKPKEGRVIEITRQLREAYYEGAISEKDRLLFVFRYVTHYIVLENVSRDERGYYINISIHSTPLFDKLYEGQAKTYDINSDKRPDILVEFLGLNASSNSTLANVRVYLLECICPAPSNWSDCREGKQSRVVYKCSEATNWICVAEVEEKACEKKEQKPLIKKKINYLLLALIIALLAILILLLVLLVKAIKQHRRQKFASKIKFYKEKYVNVLDVAKKAEL